ncbi:MAG: Crp/Fnr family transcriptional regulator [Vicinamibacteria bacterium]
MPSYSQEIRTALDSLGIGGRCFRLSKGSMVSLHEEGARSGLHFLLGGRMKTLRFSEDGRVMILDLLDTGEVFGEMALVAEGGTEPTYAEALEEVEIETFPRFALDGVLRGRTALALGIARLMAARRKQLERRLETQVFQRVPVRLASLLLELAERFGGPEEGGTVVDIPLSQQDLGNLIGASREIVSLTLSEFRRRAAVSMLGRRIVIHESKLRREVVSVS